MVEGWAGNWPRLRPPRRESVGATRGDGLRLRRPGHDPAYGLRATCATEESGRSHLGAGSRDDIHQAKGLEFDIVVLPELDAKLSGQTPPIVAGSPAPAAPIDRVCRYVGKELRGILPDDSSGCSPHARAGSGGIAVSVVRGDDAGGTWLAHGDCPSEGEGEDHSRQHLPACSARRLAGGRPVESNRRSMSMAIPDGSRARVNSPLPSGEGG